MDSALLDFELPPDRIAQAPAATREASRLLIVDRSRETFAEDSFANVGAHLRAGDLLILNDTRVIPSRLGGSKETGGAVEITLLDPRAGDDAQWALVRSSSRHRIGQRFHFPGGLELEVVELGDAGPIRLAVRQGDLRATLERHGRMPLPPYIRRQRGAGADDLDRLDRERYQTVLASREGAVAAPTAGLHFTPAVLADLAARGIEHATVTLHVGYGSFQPVRAERVEDHVLRPETFAVDEAAARRIQAQRAAGRRVVAVGTTVVRTLETAVDEQGRVTARHGSTGLMILPGHAFRAVDALITNFHQPRTTLFALALAFGGVERIRRAYRHALDAGFRFLSYGDAMLIV